MEGQRTRPVKNLFELKNAKNVVAQYNIFENHWSHAQSGYAIVFTVRNQSGSASWSTVEDVTFRYNIVKNTERVFNITNTDNNYTSQVTKNIYIENNLFFQLNGLICWLGAEREYRTRYSLHITHS